MKKPQSLEDTDLSRLYTATSLMQIDDNVMRCAHGPGWGARQEVAGQHCPAPGVSSAHFGVKVFFFFNAHCLKTEDFRTSLMVQG